MQNNSIPKPRLTLFHVFMLVGAGSAGFLAYSLASVAPLLPRLIATAFGVFAGFVLSLLAAVWLLGSVIIPRIRPGSYWEFEVECFMLSIFGDRWKHPGRG